MASEMTREEVLREAAAIAAEQAGGTLATIHAEDGTPYVTFVLCHLRESGEMLFGSSGRPQHSRNIQATPEVSFLVDNRQVIRSDWGAFNRVVLEGRAEEIGHDDARYGALLAELSAKNRLVELFTEQGKLFLVTPRRLILMKGLETARHIVEFS